MAYTCKTCGAIADEPGHLCNPCNDVTVCTFCGREGVESIHLCQEKLREMKYACESCGRVAVRQEHLCQPTLIV